MRWPSPPTARTVVALDLAWALPLIALGVWFGAIDVVALGEGRCPSCGVEPYVVVAHVIAAGWLAGVLACASASRRFVVEGRAAPGRRTCAALAVAAAFLVASLLWHQLFDIPAVLAMIASVVLGPTALLWLLLNGAVLLRRPPRAPDEAAEHLVATQAWAWVALIVLLPGMYGWVWSSRVEWLVF